MKRKHKWEKGERIHKQEVIKISPGKYIHIEYVTYPKKYRRR